MKHLTQKLLVGLEALLKNPTPTKFRIFNGLFPRMVPFNTGMGARLEFLDNNSIKVTLPNKRRNHNHLGTIHACAIATAGEMSAGLLLLRSFPLTQYRLILKELKVTYKYQARLDLRAEATLPAKSQEKASAELLDTGTTEQKIKTVITDIEGNHIADITSAWQLKSWDKVRTK